jgi:hypothetical protein
MSCQDQKDFCVGAGETFQPVIRWGTGVLISKPITGITQAAPAVVTAVGHGVPDGWQVAVVSAKGMTQINTRVFPPVGRDLHKATLLSADTVQLNDINSADYTAYTSGGFLVYNTPVVLTGMTARMIIRDAPLTGTILATLTQLAGITLDNTAKTITPILATAALTWTLGYYDLELTDVGGKITQLLTGTISIT